MLDFEQAAIENEQLANLGSFRAQTTSLGNGGVFLFGFGAIELSVASTMMDKRKESCKFILFFNKLN